MFDWRLLERMNHHQGNIDEGHARRGVLEYKAQDLHALNNGGATVVVLVMPGIAIPNAWRAIIGFFSLMVWHGMEPEAWVFHMFFLVKAHPRSQGWWNIFLCKGFSFMSSPSKLHS